MSYDTFKMRMEATGSNMRNERILDSTRNIYYSFADDPSYTDGVVFYWDNKPIHPRLYEHTNRETSTIRYQMQTTLAEPFELGDIFKLPDDSVWLCIYTDRMKTHYQGTLEYCNYMLNFEKKKDGSIITYPVMVTNATQYNSGVTDTDYITYGSSQHIFYTVMDEYTVKIDKNFRFLLDYNTTNPTAYKVTQVDTTSYSKGGKGIVRFTLVEDELRDTDDIVNMVADQTRVEDVGGEGWF